MMESAEIGVAVYSTVHTRSVPETLSRIINVFPFAERLQVAATLLSSLRLVISQRLLPLPDNNGRIALREYLAFTPEIREMLLDTRSPAGRFRSADSGCRPNRLSKRKHHQRKLSGDSGGTQRQGKE